MSDVEPRQRRRVSDIAYASGNFGKNILWGTAELTLLFVLTDMLELSPGVAGVLILLSLVFDAMLDPLVGWIADKVRSPLGRYGPFILIGSPLCALSFLLLFSLPLIGENRLAVIAGVIAVFRITYSLIDLPHNALLTHVSKDSRRRSALSLYRFFFSSLASLIIAVSLGQLVDQSSAERPLSAEGLFIFAAAAGGLSVITMTTAWISVSREDRLAATHGKSPNLRNALPALLANQPFMYALAAGTLAALYLPLFGKSLFYLCTYVIENERLISPALVGMVAGQFMGLPIWLHLSQSREKADVLRTSHSVVGIGIVSVLVTIGLAPPMLPIAAVIVGIGAAGVYGLVWSLLADCVDHGEHQSGQRLEGSLFAIAILTQKAAIGIATGIFGLSLAGVGYVKGIDPDTSVKVVILLFSAGLPLLGSFATRRILMAYSLTHTDHARTLAR